VESWKELDADAKSLAKRLMGKEASTPSRAWQLLSAARPEMILFLAITARQQSVTQKIKNFFTKWRQVQQKVPLPEMAELHITPQLPEYPKIANDVFLLLLDGKLRSRTETLKYLKPLAPPPPPPPPPPPAKRGRGAKAAAASAAPAAAVPAKGAKGKKKGAEVPAIAASAAPVSGVAAKGVAMGKTQPVSAPKEHAAAVKKSVKKPAPAKTAPAKSKSKPAAKPKAKAVKPAAKPKKKGKRR
jgi:hypothetical protein